MLRITPIALLHLHVISELLFRFTYTLWIWVFVEWFFGSESCSTLYSSLWTSSSPWTPLSVKIIDVNYLLLCSFKNQINKMVPVYIVEATLVKTTEWEIHTNCNKVYLFLCICCTWSDNEEPSVSCPFSSLSKSSTSPFLQNK